MCPQRARALRDFSTEEEEEKSAYLFRQKQKQNVSTNVIKHIGGFPEGHTPIVLDTRSNAENGTSFKYYFF